MPPRPQSGLSVLHVAQPLDAGVPACVVRFLRDQVARGLTVSVACPAESIVVPSARELELECIRWDAVRSPGWTVPDETRRLARIVRAVNPDVVHLHSAKAGLAGRLAIRGRRPTVFQPAGWSFEAVGGATRRGALAWERWAGRWTSVVVCASEWERRRGVDVGIETTWRVVPNGVDLASFRPATDQDRDRARSTLGLDDGPLVVCIGRLQEQKGQDVLLDAWPLVLADVPDATLVLVGDGPDRADLEARRVPSVQFVGHQDDIQAWLAAADVFALPSRWEGMALSMLEAMAVGRSVVTTEVSGAREALGDDAGAIVQPEDSHALGRALAVRLADRDLAAREGAAGRARAERAHDLRDANAAVAELYAELAGTVG